MIRAILLGFLIASIFSSPVFAETETLVCDYPSYSDEKGNHPVKGKFTLTFIVDKQRGTAYVLGNQGSEEVSMLPSERGWSFVEITGFGNVMVTTVDTLSNSVHSRNTVIEGKLVPTQYYGKCKFK